MSQPIDIAINRMYPGEKLPDEDPRWGKYTHSFREQSLTVDDLIAEVTQGNSFCPVMKDSHRKQDNFISAQHIGLDDDRGIPDSSIDALALDPFIADHASFLYETLSSTSEHPKSRVVFILDEPICDRARYRLAQEALWWKFSATDPHVKEESRFFYGAPNARVIRLDNVLYIDTLQEEVIEPFLRSRPSDSNGHQPMEPIGEAIAEGSRNATLTSLGGAMRRRGASGSAIEAGLLAQNADTCKPPLSLEEVQGIAHSVAKYSPEEEPDLGGPGGPNPDIVVNDDHVVLAKNVAGENRLQIRASEIRKERTGIHSRIEIRLNGILMGWTNFNVERDEDRQRFSNHCHGQLRTLLKDGYAKELLKLDLDTFCADLWGAHISSQMPVDLVGNPDLTVKFHLYPYVVEGGGTIFYAPPKKAKSYTALLVGISIDAGVSEIWNTTQAKVLFINLERSARSIQRRIGLVNTVLGLEASRSLLTLNARGRSLVDIKDIVAESVKKMGVELIILDSISRAGQGSLTEDRNVNAIVDILNNLAPSWLALAHTPRADESHVFGSVHFEAGADVMVQLMSERKGDVLGISLDIKQENDIGSTTKQLLAYEFDRFGLCGVRQARKGEFIGVEAEKRSTTDLLVDYIQEHGGRATATQAANDLDLNRGDVSYAFNHGEEFVKLGKEGTAVFFGLKTRANS